MTPLAEVQAQARQVELARRRAAAAEQKLHELIRTALAAGKGATAIAAATGLSRARVYQIRNGVR